MRKINKFYRDIIAYLHSSLTENKKSKQLGLGLSMKSGIIFKEFVNYLNYFNHSISHDVFLRTDTSWAMELMDA